MRASALLLALAALTAQAFVPFSPAPAPAAHRQRVAPLRMGFFDALKKGFENEAQESPAPNAGLKNVRAWMFACRWGRWVGGGKSGRTQTSSQLFSHARLASCVHATSPTYFTPHTSSPIP